MAKICVVRQFYFPLDPRVRREADALLQAGHEVDVVCMQRDAEPTFERHGRLTIYRLPLSHRRGGIARYLKEYGYFLAMAVTRLALLHFRRRYDLVQVNSLPDTLVFAALVPKLMGARVLLDLHECMPEFFASKFKTNLGHPGVRLMSWLEQASIRFADYAITCTEQQREVFVARGSPPHRIGVVMNASDEAAFDPIRIQRQRQADGKFVLLSHGTVEERYGLDTVVRAIALLKHELPQLCFRVIGEGAYLEQLEALAVELGVEGQVLFHDRFMPIDDLVQAIADADLGVVAMKRDAFRDLTHCNKMFDYITMRVPAIMSRTRAVEASFDEDCFGYFRSEDAADLARVIRELYVDPDRRRHLVERADRTNQRYRWHHQRARYLAIVESLVHRRRPVPARQRPDPRAEAPSVHIRERVEAAVGE